MTLENPVCGNCYFAERVFDISVPTEHELIKDRAQFTCSIKDAIYSPEIHPSPPPIHGFNFECNVLIQGTDFLSFQARINVPIR